jgi:hypothetical protein
LVGVEEALDGKVPFFCENWGEQSTSTTP